MEAYEYIIENQIMPAMKITKALGRDLKFYQIRKFTCKSSPQSHLFLSTTHFASTRWYTAPPVLWSHGICKPCACSTRDLFCCSSSCPKMLTFNQHLLLLHFCWLFSDVMTPEKSSLLLQRTYVNTFLQPSIRHLV